MNDLAETTRQPLIELVDVRKIYNSAGLNTEVLRGVSLCINAGEFVAIVGKSGSGKSTLLNIIGLLDRPSEGIYRLAGRDMSRLTDDECAHVRRNAFGFVFQQYNLIPQLSALANVELPASYEGISGDVRSTRAQELLRRLGLGSRADHKPAQLSGGQQQRVSIARALMNNANVILADEPTGALDSESGSLVLELLSAVADRGHTVILVTHDESVARRADRIIEIKDGRVEADTVTERPVRAHYPNVANEPIHGYSSRLIPTVGDAIRSGAATLRANAYRTALTLLGIVVGVAAIVALSAIGQGARQSVMDELSALGGNRLYVSPGSENVRNKRGQLYEVDVAVVRDIPNVVSAMPYLKEMVTVRRGNTDVSAWSDGVTSKYLRMHNMQMAQGAFFTEADEQSLATVAVLGHRLARKLFPSGDSPLGQMILVNNVPFTIVGVFGAKGNIGDTKIDDNIALPYKTASRRVTGRQNLSWISIEIEDIARAAETEKLVHEALERFRRTVDFETSSEVSATRARLRTQDIMTWLLGGAAGIALFVGGIGIMNIMLMAVAERTREIGIRIAIGARRRDILRQFLVESLLVSSIGALAGAVLGIGMAAAAAIFFQMHVILSLSAIAVAITIAIGAGFVFGLAPAWRASRLEPVTALARE